MEFNGYQALVAQERSGDKLPSLSFLTSGLAVDAQEAFNLINDLALNSEELSPQKLGLLKTSMSGCLYWLAEIATTLSLNLDDIAQEQLDVMLGQKGKPCC